MSRIHKLQVDVVKRPAGGSSADSDWRRSRNKADRRGSFQSTSSLKSTMLTNSNRMIIDKSSLYLSLKPHESNAFEEINLNAAGADTNRTPVNEVATSGGGR